MAEPVQPRGRQFAPRSAPDIHFNQFISYNLKMPTLTKSNSRKSTPANGKTRVNSDYKVRDLSLAEWGRKEISVAEQEMPGLMSIREKYGAQKPLNGVRVTGSLHIHI